MNNKQSCFISFKKFVAFSRKCPVSFTVGGNSIIKVNTYHGYFVDDRKSLTETPINRKSFFSSGGVGCPPSRPPVDALGKGGSL